VLKCCLEIKSELTVSPNLVGTVNSTLTITLSQLANVTLSNDFIIRLNFATGMTLTGTSCLGHEQDPQEQLPPIVNSFVVPRDSNSKDDQLS
jgi:hypothetical protein